jgi:hypothetical protein
MKPCLVAPLVLLAFGTFAQAQNQPPVNTPPSFGFSLPTVEGTMSYSLSASESFLTGEGDGNVDHTTSLSGNFAYLSSSVSKPFSMVYSGGYLETSVPGTPSNSTFQNLAFSQVITTKNWNFVVDDAVSYLPQAPTTGLSGIPGVGDIGVTPVQIGDEPSQSILTNYESRVSNGLNASATRKLDGDWSLNGSGSYQILRFLGDQGIDTTSGSGTLGPSYRIDARSSASANLTYSYTSDDLSGASFPFTSEGLNFQYQRQFTRFLSGSVSGGPQFAYGTGVAESLIPRRLDLVANAGLSYTRRVTTLSVTYARATNSGSGVIYGALTDDVAGTLSRQFGRAWQAALTASYARSSALAQVAGVPSLTQGVYGGAQLSRKLSRSFFAFGSYTAITQSVDQTGAAPTAFHGLDQVFAIGITYSPGPIHLGHF